MHFNPYGGPPAQVAAAVVNAGSQPAAELVALIREAGMRSLPALTKAQADAVIAWGSRLRPVFTEPELDQRIELINGLLRESSSQPYVSQHDGLPAHLHYADERADPVRRLQAYTAGGLAHALCADACRVGQCAGVGCVTVFVDTSRNGRRRFCATRCATRVYVAEHRDRRRAS